MKQAKEIVRIYHTFSEEISYKRQVRRLSNDLSRDIEAVAAKDFRQIGYSIPVKYYADIKKELIENGYKITNERAVPEQTTVAFTINW